MKLVLPTFLMLTAVASAQEGPPPGAESGRLDDSSEPRDGTGRKLGRALLAFPRLAVDVVLAPVRFVLWADDRYHIQTRAHELFYTENENVSILPRVSYESGIGFRVGAQLDWRFENDDHFRAFAGTGFVAESMRFAASYSTSIEDRVAAHVGADFEQRPDAEFFGIGNEDTKSPPNMPVAAEEVAVGVHYKQRLARAAGSVDTRLFSDLHLATSASLAERTRGPSETGTSIEMVYAPDSLVGFDKYRTVYGELDLKWDTRRAGSPWDLRTTITQGSLFSVWGGPTWITEAEDYWRYGTDLQHYFRLSEAPRVLSVRFHGEAVSAPHQGIPFNELPTLGGSRLLRGYELERFRDKISGVATLEYQWDIGRQLYASVFVDSGRVYSAWDQLTLSDLRTGYGVALELHAPDSPTAAKVFRGSIASSVDGGVFFNFYLEPIFGVTPRVERR
jgi:hypothetical protein